MSLWYLEVLFASGANRESARCHSQLQARRRIVLLTPLLVLAIAARLHLRRMCDINTTSTLATVLILFFLFTSTQQTSSCYFLVPFRPPLVRLLPRLLLPPQPVTTTTNTTTTTATAIPTTLTARRRMTISTATASTAFNCIVNIILLASFAWRGLVHGGFDDVKILTKNVANPSHAKFEIVLAADIC